MCTLYTYNSIRFTYFTTEWTNFATCIMSYGGTRHNLSVSFSSIYVYEEILIHAYKILLKLVMKIILFQKKKQH